MRYVLDISISESARIYQIENITYIHERRFENYDIAPTMRFVIKIARSIRRDFFFNYSRGLARNQLCAAAAAARTRAV